MAIRSVECVECDEEVRVDTEEVEDGDIVSCEHCQTEMVIGYDLNDNPYAEELDNLDDDEDDEDEEGFFIEPVDLPDTFDDEDEEEEED